LRNYFDEMMAESLADAPDAGMLRHTQLQEAAGGARYSRHPGFKFHGLRHVGLERRAAWCTSPEQLSKSN
jgi:hypothetical protein